MFGDAHVVAKDLLELEFGLGIDALDDKLGRKDVGELGAVSVASAGGFLFVVVKVGSGEQVSKDEGGNVHLLLLVEFNGDSFSVVFDGDPIALGIDGDLEAIHVGIALFVVCRIDDDFVKDLVESGRKGDFLLHDLLVLNDVHGSRQSLDASNVRIGTQQNVFQLRFLLVFVFHCLFLFVRGTHRNVLLVRGGGVCVGFGRRRENHLARSSSSRLFLGSRRRLLAGLLCRLCWLALLCHHHVLIVVVKRIVVLRKGRRGGHIVFVHQTEGVFAIGGCHGQ